MMTQEEEWAQRETYDRRREKEKKEFDAAFTIAGIETQTWWALENQYWPATPRYFTMRTPWYLVHTQYGLMQIGWRKKVIAVFWHNTEVRGQVTEDDVTKADNMVHAWTTQKLVEYLTKFKQIAEETLSEKRAAI